MNGSISVTARSIIARAVRRRSRSRSWRQQLLQERGDVSLHLDHPTSRRKISLRRDPAAPQHHPSSTCSELGPRGPRLRGSSRLSAPASAAHATSPDASYKGPHAQQRPISPDRVTHRPHARSTACTPRCTSGAAPAPRAPGPAGTPSRGARDGHYAPLASSSLHYVPVARHLHNHHGLQHRYSSVLALRLSNPTKESVSPHLGREGSPVKTSPQPEHTSGRHSKVSSTFSGGAI